MELKDSSIKMTEIKLIVSFYKETVHSPNICLLYTSDAADE